MKMKSKSYKAGGSSKKVKMAKAGKKLVGGQSKLDMNKDGKLSGADFKMMQNGGNMMSKGMDMMNKVMMKYGGKKKKKK